MIKPHSTKLIQDYTSLQFYRSFQILFIRIKCAPTIKRNFKHKVSNFICSMFIVPNILENSLSSIKSDFIIVSNIILLNGKFESLCCKLAIYYIFIHILIRVDISKTQLNPNNSLVVRIVVDDFFPYIRNKSCNTKKMDKIVKIGHFRISISLNTCDIKSKVISRRKP